MDKEIYLTEKDLKAIQSILKFSRKNKIKSYNHLVDSGLMQEKGDLFHLTIKYRDFLVDYFNGIQQYERNQKLNDIVNEVRNIAWNTN